MLTITNIQRANVACSSKINKSRMSNRVVNNVPFGPQRLNQMTQRHRQSPICAAAQAETGKLISKVEIPPFIPRSDLMDQLMRWAIINVQEDGVANLGSACKVTPNLREGLTWGFTVSFLKDGEPATDIQVGFDEEIALKSEWVGRGADGFPILEGDVEEVLGKYFVIRKICDRPVNEHIRQSIKDFCTLLVAAINKYYAFGSCFADDRE